MSENEQTSKSAPSAAAPTGELAPCWSRIGVDGDGSCPELISAIHCRNCHVYSDAGRMLFDRESPAEYKDEWSDRLAIEKETESAATLSAVIFSIQSEYLALSTAVFSEVSEQRTIRKVPGARHSLLLGLINIRGEIHLCVSLRGLLGLGAGATGVSAGSPASVRGRMLLIQRAGDVWAFPADDVFGTYRLNLEKMAPPPSTVDRASSRYSRGTVEWEGKTVGLLDDAAVFAALKGIMA